MTKAFEILTQPTQVAQVAESKVVSSIIGLLIDETGSMQRVKNQTVTGCNAYIQGLQGETTDTNKADVTIATFNKNGVKFLYQATDVRKVDPFTDDNYLPRADTNLYDATGRMIVEIEQQLAKRTDDPSVIISVMTDGKENCSQEYNLEAIRALIDEKQKAGWTFIFLAANIQAQSNIAPMGFDAANSVVYGGGNEAATLRAHAASQNKWRADGAPKMQKAFFADYDDSKMFRSDVKSEVNLGTMGSPKKTS